MFCNLVQRFIKVFNRLEKTTMPFTVSNVSKIVALNEDGRSQQYGEYHAWNRLFTENSFRNKTF